jgi:D-beta-D-heptose 7-phosphate kinase/D-beta-D-heptose 1-phosphate adenosyltransferase
MLNKNLTTFLKNNKKNISKSKILCIGDIILDYYIYGKVERLSPEAPVPILMMKREKYEIGGVGNVAVNISNMGAKTTLICLSGNDLPSVTTNKLLSKHRLIKNLSIKVPNFKTPIKTRFINDVDHLLRVDNENINFKSINKYKILIIKKIKKEIEKNDVIVLSDYNKGMLDKDLIKKIIKIATQYNKIIIADPKKIDLSSYEGINILTPNQKEITESAKKKFLNETDLIKYAKNTVKKYNIQNLLITRSEKGMLLVNDKSVTKVKANAKKVRDVTGAGDTVIAILALMITLRLSIEDSIKISNHAAGLVIGKSGTACVKYSDLI